MADEITYQIVIQYTKNGKTFTVPGDALELDAGDEMVSGIITVTQASAITLDLGGVDTATLAYFRNLDDTNSLEVRDDTDVLCDIPAEQACLLHLDSGLTSIKAQADTADCLMEYVVFEA